MFFIFLTTLLILLAQVQADSKENCLRPSPPKNTKNLPIQRSPAYTSALAHAAPGLKRAAFEVEIAEHDPEGPRPAVWGGEGINCVGNYLCGRDICEMVEYRKVLTPTMGFDLDFMYGAQENIACLNSTIEDGVTCLYLEDVERKVSGLEIVVLMSILWNHGCERCGKVPLRLIEDGINDLSHGALQVDQRVAHGGCNGVCGRQEMLAGKEAEGNDRD